MKVLIERRINMPIGIITDCLCVFIGGIIGTVFGKHMSLDFKEKLNMIFGACAFAISISSIILMKNMPAVILAVVIGSIIGILMHFGDLVTKLGMGMKSIIFKFMKEKESDISDEEFDSTLLTIILLFCAGGTGIYGAMVSGMSGDHTILIAKAILDIFTAMIFACLLGPVVSFIAIPQFILYIILFICGGLIVPYTTPVMIDDFKAVGGIILLAIGFRMLRLKDFPTGDMIPALIIAMPVSYIWTNFIVPLLGFSLFKAFVPLT